MTGELLPIVGGALLLVGGGEALVRGAASLARTLGVSVMLVGLTVVAYGTSAPEFVVSVSASWSGNPAICAGNVVGSNILNVLLVLGTTALICPLKVTAGYVRREVPIMVGVSALFWLLASDGGLSRIDAIVLLGLLAGYTGYTIRIARQERKSVAEEFEDIPHVKRHSIARDLLLLGVGLVLLGIGSQIFLSGAINLAERLGISQTIIGLTLVAGGTSFPELAASLIAAWRKHPDICLGNIIGSSIYNILGIAGTAGVISALPIEPDMLRLHIPVMVLSAAILWPMIYTGYRVSRREGLLLLAMYGGYLTWTVSRALAG